LWQVLAGTQTCTQIRADLWSRWLGSASSIPAGFSHGYTCSEPRVPGLVLSLTQHHTPIRLLQPIPIPSQPFEVVSMDFYSRITPLWWIRQYLVIVDKITSMWFILPLWLRYCSNPSERGNSGIKSIETTSNGWDGIGIGWSNLIGVWCCVRLSTSPGLPAAHYRYTHGKTRRYGTRGSESPVITGLHGSGCMFGCCKYLPQVLV